MRYANNLYSECHYAEFCHFECRYTECCYSECHNAECCYVWKSLCWVSLTWMSLYWMSWRRSGGLFEIWVVNLQSITIFWRISLIHFLFSFSVAHSTKLFDQVSCSAPRHWTILLFRHEWDCHSRENKRDRTGQDRTEWDWNWAWNTVEYRPLVVNEIHQYCFQLTWTVAVPN